MAVKGLLVYLLFFTGTFFRHLEQGNKEETTTSSASQDHAEAGTSNTCNSFSSEDEDELSDLEESVGYEIGS